MKKKLMALCLLLSCVTIAKDIEGQARIGFQASFGIEGLSNLNIDKLGTIQMFKTKVDPPKTSNLQSFIENIQKIDTINKKNEKILTPNNTSQAQLHPSQTSNNRIITRTPKDIAKDLILRGIQIDSTLFDGHIKMNKIGTTIGAKVYGKTSRVGEDLEIHKVGRAKIFANVDTEKFKMNNTLYLKGYDKKIVGLDKFRVEDDVDGKSNIQFDSEGVISPFITRIKPELAYKASFGDRKEFLIAPGISTNILDTATHQLNLTANYYVSTFKKDKLDIDEIKHDLQDLAPGNMNVEYFKNWELGKTRGIQKGILDGKNGSIRAIGHPTGALYGENVVSYAMKKVYEAIISESGEAGKKLYEIVKKVREEKGKATLDDIIYLAKKEHQEELIGLKDKFYKLYPKFLNEALQELGVIQPNREVSSYHLSQYIPNNYVDIIKELASKNEKNEAPKMQPRNANDSKKENKYGELEYLFPKDNLKGLTTILGSQKFIESIDSLTKVFDKLQPNIEYFEKIKKDIDDINKKNEEGKCGLLDWDETCSRLTYGKNHYVEILNNAKLMKNEIITNKEKINKALDKSIYLLKQIAKEFEDNKNNNIKQIIQDLEKIKENVKGTLNFLDENIIGKLINISPFIGTITSFKDVKKNYTDKFDKVVGEFGTKIVKNSTDIIFDPQTIPSFDMLLGLNIVKSEHDAIKYDYEKAMLEKLKEDAYKPHDEGISHGLNVNLLYANKAMPLYVNTNIDFARYSKLNSKMTRVGLSNEISYTPKEYSLSAKTGLLYKDIMLHDLSYSKLNIDTDIALKLNFVKSKWLFRPGIRYVGNFEYVNTKNSVVEVEVFKRDKDGNLIDNNDNSVDISKESRYQYDKDLKKSFKTEKVKSSSKWLKPTNTIIPTFDVVYSPKENISLEYNLLVPVKFVGENFDGIMIKNGLGLTIKF